MISKLKKVYFYLFGILLAKHFYRREVFYSKHFSSPGSKGWLWLYHSFFWQKIIGINRSVPWPVSFKISVIGAENIIFDYNDLNNFMTHGNYFQATGAKLEIGSGTYIAPNVGIITENHDLHDPSKRGVGKEVVIGKKCWIGMNSMILPGVKLGDNIIVGAGSIVTKSFSEGRCVIAGNPARLIKKLD